MRKRKREKGGKVGKRRKRMEIKWGKLTKLQSYKGERERNEERDMKKSMKRGKKERENEDTAPGRT